ncbi:Uncharacterized protein SCG7109_BF_00040 [Chlamydiales bacterium SCGC AG-110-M15]|nr:Uncharacterized protein SCG7109_BF_00040 [Chlamydiales bacterium SCGC AG-110-M15]
MIEEEELILSSLHHDVRFPVDISWKGGGEPRPVVIFSHGFKGFKDWGPFPFLARHFAAKGYVFARFNFSHNGTTVEHPQELVDLEAFAQNNFTIELDDLGVVIDSLIEAKDSEFHSVCDFNRIFLLGHSRGGSLSILKACEDKRVKAVATWAAVSDYESRWEPQDLEVWKSRGTVYFLNRETQQKLPVSYQIVEDYYDNRERLDVEVAIERMSAPLLLAHAKDDPSVPVGMAYSIKEAYEPAELLIHESGGHYFGGYHPFRGSNFPVPMGDVVRETMSFFEKEAAKLDKVEERA